MKRTDSLFTQTEVKASIMLSKMPQSCTGQFLRLSPGTGHRPRP